MVKKCLFTVYILCFCLTFWIGVNAQEIYLNDTITTPYLLNQANKTYVLTSDITADQPAFVIKGNNIILDLNGHTLTFNNGNAVEIPNRDFEDWTGDLPDNWTVLSGIPQKSQSIYFGSYDLVFPPSGGKIRSASVTLKANKTYLAFMFAKGASENATATLRLLRASNGEALKSWTNSSAVLSRGYASKGSTDSDLLYKSDTDIEIMLEVECAGTSTTYFRIGMVDIKPALDYGVVAAGYKNNYIEPDINANYFSYPTPSNIIIKNGTIIQGQGQGVRCVGILPVGSKWQIDKITMRMNGINTDGISAPYPGDLTVKDSSIYSTSLSVFNRMHGTGGIAIGNPSGAIVIQNNLIDGVPQMGIMIYACLCNPASYEITGNTIRQRELVTEGYAIGGSGMQNFTIADNIIQPYQGRGILLDSSSGCAVAADKGDRNGVIRNNQILNLYEVRNQEYSEDGLECVGIRIRNWGGTTPMHENIKIYGNTITGHTDSAGVHAVYGINITASAPGDSIEIYDNTIELTAEGSGRLASAITFQDTHIQGDSFIFIHNNTLKTNSTFLRFGGNDGGNALGLYLENNDFIRLSSPNPVGKPFMYGYWIGKAKDNILVNNTGVDVKVKDNFTVDGSTGEKNLIIGRHKIDVMVKGVDSQALSGAKVYLKDSAGVVLMEKTTGASGKVLFYSPEVYYAGTNSITQRVFIDGEGFIIEAVNSENEAISESVTMDSAKVVMLSFGSELDPLDINQDGEINILDIQICINVLFGTEKEAGIVLRADVNGDERVDVSDVYIIVGKILENMQ